ncbi:MAG: glycosyltransferase family 2 protein [Anaerolineales bacterium]|nr:glycosyltransferase family 2 protein [Anaerolineales bacterium]
MAISIGCIVPAYNESRRINTVLRVLTAVQGLQTILVVDDGSTDGTADRLIRHPKLRVLRLPRNRGKAAAVLAGARQLRTDYLLLVDADLRRPRRAEFARALAALHTEPGVDMLVLRRVSKSLLTRSLRGDLLISGERIVRRGDLLAMLAQHPVQGYQLEVALNQYMLDHDKQVRWLPISSVGLLAIHKLGLRSGLRKELGMFRDIFKYLGLSKLLWQMLIFGRQQASSAE